MNIVQNLWTVFSSLFSKESCLESLYILISYKMIFKLFFDLNWMESFKKEDEVN